MNNYNLQYLDYYLPETILSVKDLVDLVDQHVIPPVFETKADYLMFTKDILEQENVLIEAQLSEVEMLNGLLTKLFSESEIKPAEIDLIVTCQEGNQNTSESFVKCLQHEHKMTNANVMNLSGNHCANVPVIWDFINSIQSSMLNILIVAANKTANPNDRILGAYGILSDGVGIALLSGKPGVCSIKNQVKLSNGSLYKVDMNKDNSLLHYKYMTAGVKRLMENSGIAVGSLACVIPQNANILLLSKVAMGMGIDTRKIFSQNISRSGHVDSVDFIINLKDILDEGKLKSGDTMLALNMGWAGSYVSSLITVN